MKRWLMYGGLIAALSVPQSAYAVFGEEDWLSGQNQTLIAMLAAELDTVANLAQVITTLRHALRAANDTLALARTVARMYEAVRTYTAKDLERDALAGFYEAFPEARHAEGKMQRLWHNGRLIQRGPGSFFSYRDASDARVSGGVQALFEHGYKAALWPQVLPSLDAPAATPVEKMIQARYRRSGEAALRAMQQSSFHVLAKKARAFAADADDKPRLDLKMQAAGVQLEVQQAQDTTELLNLERQRAAEAETLRRDDAAFQQVLKQTLTTGAQTLVTPPGGQDG